MGVSGSKALTKNLKQCTLWKANRSPACRAVMMTLDAVNLNVTEVDINLDRGEHKRSEIAALNPLQTLPVFKDGDVVLSESHAICSYLVSRYPNGGGGRFLPSDPGSRALVDQVMHYNSSVLYPRYRAVVDPVIFEKTNIMQPEELFKIECSYAELENMLRGKRWLAGDWTTLGDITVGATVSTLNCLVPIEKTRHPLLYDWLKRLSEEHYYVTANRKGLDEFVRKISKLIRS